MIRTSACSLLVLAAASTVARADRLPTIVKQVPSTPEFEAKHKDDTEKALSGIVIYLNKCTGGCNVKPGTDNPETDTSVIVAAPVQLAQHAWQTGEWEGIVQCVKEVYSPYNVVITDVRPTGQQYNEVIVAGGATAIGGQASCGLAAAIGQPGSCAPLLGVVAFAFVDDGCYGQYRQEDPDSDAAGNPLPTAIRGLCWVVAQESAHDLGLDHAFGKFDSGQSTCNDPMTYQADCGGQKFFRNDFAPCNGNDGLKKSGCGGSNECGAKQNSHMQLLNGVGASPSGPITTAPVTTLIVPMANASVMANTAVIAKARAQRGVARVELWLNGYKWADAKGVAFGTYGQPEGAYTLNIPAGVPDSKIDLVVKSFDDINVEGDSTLISVVKGKAAGCDASVTNPDGTIDTCLKGQECNAGRCQWTDAGMGKFGDACTYDQFCTGGTMCEGTATSTICTHSCDPSIKDSCPMNFDCIATGTTGVCFTAQPASGGCCSVGSDGLPAVGLGLTTLGLLFGRRRRRIG